MSIFGGLVRTCARNCPLKNELYTRSLLPGVNCPPSIMGQRGVFYGKHQCHLNDVQCIRVFTDQSDMLLKVFNMAEDLNLKRKTLDKFACVLPQ